MASVPTHYYFLFLAVPTTLAHVMMLLPLLLWVRLANAHCAGRLTSALLSPQVVVARDLLD